MGNAPISWNVEEGKILNTFLASKLHFEIGRKQAFDKVIHKAYLLQMRRLPMSQSKI